MITRLPFLKRVSGEDDYFILGMKQSVESSFGMSAEESLSSREHPQISSPSLRENIDDQV
jgi:hypothetical protein